VLNYLYAVELHLVDAKKQNMPDISNTTSYSGLVTQFDKDYSRANVFKCWLVIHTTSDTTRCRMFAMHVSY